MKNKRKKRSLPIFLGVVAVWFGRPGATSGRQISQFFGSYGKWGLLFSLIAMIVLGLCVFIAIDFARMKKIYNFKDWANAFYHPYEKIFSTIYEIIFIMTVIVAVSACVAVGAQAMQDSIGLPYFLSAGVLVLITISMTMYGANLLRNVASLITTVIIVCLTSVIIYGFMSPQADLSTSLSSMSFDTDIILKAFISGLLYAGFQTTGIISNTVSVSDSLVTRKDSIKVAIVGVVIDYSLIAAIILLLYSYPNSLSQALPIYWILKSIKGGALMFGIYTMVLELAIIATLAGFCFSVTARYNKFIPASSAKIRDFLCTSITMAICLGFAQFGIISLVKRGYAYIGYVGIALVILPILIFGPYKLKNAAKEMK